jgi:hypothetical protein
MRHLAERFGAECLVLAYDQFTADRRFVEAFCQAVLAAGLQQLPWYCISRLDSVDAPLLALMREAGCESLCYGIDSGSPRTLAFIGKEIDAGILGQRVRETTATGIVPTLSFVIGFPEEERSDLDATLQLALMAAAQGDVNPLVQLPTVLAGTGLADRYGAKLVREVDTYFSLGLEFDGGVRRLPDDEQLIDSDPPLFSSFYNLPCAGISLGELDRIARWFPLILSGYPKTLLLLCATVHESPSLLLGRFLAALSEEGWHAAEANAEVRFLDRFPSFAAQVAGAVASGPWRHLPEVITYETLALRAAPCPHCDTAASGDAGDGQPDAASRPVRAGHVTVGEFTRNMAAIIADLRQGIVRDDYPVEPSILVFHPLAGRVEVTEINPFGRDLLAQCDGAATCAEIAGRLYQDYGTTLALPDFTACCADALATFGSLALVRQGEGDHPTGKEVIPC